VRLQRLLGQSQILSLPSFEETTPWHRGLQIIAETEALLEAGDFHTVLQRCASSHDDYQWFWALFEIHARIGLDFDASELVDALEPNHKDPGLERALARDYAKALRAAVLTGETKQLEALTSSPIGVTARFLCGKSARSDVERKRPK
jgi:hypothetical protein